jgi:putative intracellular protease/amidase
MQIAILLYDRVAALDAVGPYEVLAKIPDAETVMVGEHTGPVRTQDRQLGLLVDAALDDVHHPDVIVVPGGAGKSAHLTDGPVHHWLRAVDTTTAWTTSVCTGAFILATAGLLKGKHATSYWRVVDQLADHDVIPVHERVVTDGKYITGAGVSAGIDMALTLAAHLAGHDTARDIQLDIEYDPKPPYTITHP